MCVCVYAYDDDDDDDDDTCNLVQPQVASGSFWLFKIAIHIAIGYRSFHSGMKVPQSIPRGD